MNQDLDGTLEQILSISNECIRSFRINDDVGGYKKIIDLIEKIQIFAVILSEMSLSENIPSFIANLNSVLTQITEGIASRDSVLISDLVEFELIPLIEPLRGSN